jgi:hypothetical protein
LAIAKSPKEPATYVEKSLSSIFCTFNNTLFFLTIAPSFWCIYLFTTTLLFLLKKKSVGVIYSIGICMISPMSITSALGFPMVNCNGVIDSMGLSIYVDNYFSYPYIVDLSCEDNGLSSPLFFNVSD